MIRSSIPQIRMRDSAAGMGRFFSPSNLGRYRKLASGTTTEIEQLQLLKDLADEMNAFRRESHGVSANSRTGFYETVGS